MSSPVESAAIPTLSLALPDGVAASTYAQVRQVEALGDVLDGQLIPALQAGGEPGAVVAAFHSAREQGTAVLPTGPTTAEEGLSMATGPGPEPVAAAFDRVCTDALRAWFIAAADAVAAGDGHLADKVGRIEQLENLATTAFPWDADAGGSVSVRVKLVSAALQER